MCARSFDRDKPSKTEKKNLREQLTLDLDGTGSSAKEETAAHRDQEGHNTSGNNDRLHIWLKTVDQILIDRAGLTTGLFDMKTWKHLFWQDMRPAEASSKAIKSYRRGNANAEKHRRELLILLSAEQEGLLTETINQVPEKVLRDALRVSSGSQQRRIERLLEQRVSQMAN